MQHLTVEVKQNPSEAPDYNTPPYTHFKKANLKKIIVVHNGMTSGRATLDLQFETEDGAHYVAMVSAALLHNAIALTPPDHVDSQDN